MMKKLKRRTVLRLETLENRELLSVSPWNATESEPQELVSIIAPEMEQGATSDATAYASDSIAYDVEATLISEGQDPDNLTEDFIFGLNSYEDSEYTVYLDFTGHETTGTLWNRSYGTTITTPVFTLDANSGFSNDELLAIYETWLVVSEDLMPFNVNVTTDEASASAIGTQSIRVCIGGTNDDWYNKGEYVTGVSYLGSFDWNSDTPAFVFAEECSGGIEIGNTASHEIGHSLGLCHGDESVENGKGTYVNEWYYDGNDGWAPIMGSSCNPLVQWSTKEYHGVSTEDYKGDLETIDSILDYRTDDYSNNRENATKLTFTTDATLGSGIIEKNTDVDWFKLELDGNQTDTIIIGGIENVTNLDVLVNLYEEDGTHVSIADPTNVYYAYLDTTGLSGTYYISVEGTGLTLNDGTTAYSDYGSLGEYTIRTEILETDALMGDVPGTMGLAERITFDENGEWSGKIVIGDDKEHDDYELNGVGGYFFDVDMFQFNVEAENVDSYYTILIETLVGDSSGSRVRIFNDKGEAVYNDSICYDSDQLPSFKPTEAGTYYLGISNQGNDTYDPKDLDSKTPTQVSDPKYKYSAMISITIGASATVLSNLKPYKLSAYSDIILLYTDANSTTGAYEFTTEDKICVQYSTQNASRVDITDSFCTKLELYKEDTWEASIQDVSYLSSGRGAGYSSSNANSPWNIGQLDAGTYRIQLTVDPENQIAESNEDDNTYSVEFTVKSDVSVSDGGVISSESLTWGDTFSLTTGDIINLGSGASGDYTVKFYASTDQNIGDDDDILLGKTAISSLASGGTTTATLTGIDSTDLSAGVPYFFGWIIESPLDSDETNNIGMLSANSIQITPKPLVAPTLTITKTDAHSVTLSVDEVANATGYELEYSTGEDFQTDKQTQSVNVGENTITNLNANTMYYFRVKALGTGNYSASQYSETLTATTGKNSISNSTITLSRSTLRVGDTVTATLEEGITAEYQWYSCETQGEDQNWTAIDGATENSYAVGNDLVQHYLKCVATGTENYEGKTTSAVAYVTDAENIFHTRVVNQSHLLGSVQMPENDAESVSEWGFYLELWCELFGNQTFKGSYNSDLYTIDEETSKALEGYGLNFEESTTEEGEMTMTIKIDSNGANAELTGNTLLATVAFKAKSEKGSLSAGEKADWVISVDKEDKETEAFSVVYDLDDDGEVDIYDLVEFARSFNDSSDPNSESYQENAWKCDFDGNGKVEIFDLVLFARNYSTNSKDIANIVYDDNYVLRNSKAFPAETHLETLALASESIIEPKTLEEAELNLTTSSNQVPYLTDLAIVSYFDEDDEEDLEAKRLEEWKMWG